MSEHAPVAVTGIWLRYEGGENDHRRVVVLPEFDGLWVEVFREDGEMFGHIVEPDGMRHAASGTGQVPAQEAGL